GYPRWRRQCWNFNFLVWRFRCCFSAPWSPVTRACPAAEATKPLAKSLRLEAVFAGRRIAPQGRPVFHIGNAHLRALGLVELLPDPARLLCPPQHHPHPPPPRRRNRVRAKPALAGERIERAEPRNPAAKQAAVGGDQRRAHFLAIAFAQGRAQIADAVGQSQLDRHLRGPELAGEQGLLVALQLAPTAFSDLSNKVLVDVFL